MDECERVSPGSVQLPAAAMLTPSLELSATGSATAQAGLRSGESLSPAPQQCRNSQTGSSQPALVLRRRRAPAPANRGGADLLAVCAAKSSPSPGDPTGSEDAKCEQSQRLARRTSGTVATVATVVQKLPAGSTSPSSSRLAPAQPVPSSSTQQRPAAQILLCGTQSGHFVSANICAKIKQVQQDQLTSNSHSSTRPNLGR